MKLNLDREGKPVGLPFFYNYGLSDFGSQKEMEDHVSEMMDDFKAIKSNLRPNEPNYMCYPLGMDDPRYQSDLRMWESGVVQDRVFEKHNPKSQPDMDFLALSSRNPKDKQAGAEILRNREFITNQLNKAAEYRSLGDEKRASEAEARAAMMSREIAQTRKKSPYSFDVEANRIIVNHGKSELEEATKKSPSEIEANREYYEGLVTTFNATHDGEFSFCIDSVSDFDPHRSGEPRVIKIDHGGMKANVIAKMAEGKKMSHLDSLLTQGYGTTNPKAKEKEAKIREEPFSQEKFEQSLRPVQ